MIYMFALEPVPFAIAKLILLLRSKTLILMKAVIASGTVADSFAATQIEYEIQLASVVPLDSGQQIPYIL